MIEAVGEKGYLAMTVADVIAVAGVSRKAFYEHFPNKQDCFLTAFDTVITSGLVEAANAYRRTGSLHNGVVAAITVLFEHAAMNPLAVRLVMIEVSAVGPEGIARREQHMSAYEEILGNSLGLSVKKQAEPKPILRTLVGGLNEVLYGLVQSRRRAEQKAVVTEIAAWVMSYHPIPPAIAAGAAIDGVISAVRVGGRAPGTLSPPSTSSGRRGLRGERTSSHSYVIHNQRERILDAVAILSAAKGYAAVTVRDIADQAAVSLDAFYAHFLDKEDAFLVAYEVGHHKSLAVVERAFSEAPDWRRGVPAAINALFDFLACEPTFAHLALVDALLATPRTAERARKGVGTYEHMITQGLEELSPSEQPPGVTAAAITGGIFELCSAYAMQQRTATLPATAAVATYFALAPFIGPKEAARLAENPDAAPR
ncbi:MAG: TetR/AcrR family transcriptional regulator [Solirubrobacterales bacterium]|nr:TetR/AcrR family transcriptional regulator [Solirubrobacterales bacterium]